MAKKTKVVNSTKNAQSPSIYEGFDLKKDETLNLKIAINAQNDIFKYDGACPLVPAGVLHQWNNQSQFEMDCPRSTMQELHKTLFKQEIPKDQDSIITSLYVWKAMMRAAKDRTAAGNPINVRSAVTRKSSYATRKYRVTFTGDLAQACVNAQIATPQAVTCLRILSEACGDATNPTPGFVTEADLKLIVEARKVEIKTRQDAWRIFQYYRPTLIAAKLMAHD